MLELEQVQSLDNKELGQQGLQKRSYKSIERPEKTNDFLLIPILNNNETNEKECFLPITGGLSEFIVCPICLPNNEVWYKHDNISKI